MHHIIDSAQCNAEQKAESSLAVLVQMLHQHVRSFVLTTPQFAELLGKSEPALRLAESRHRCKFGNDMLPPPLYQNAEGRAWSIYQVARWLAQHDGQNKAAPSARSCDQPARRPGRPRKSSLTSGDLA